MLSWQETALGEGASTERYAESVVHDLTDPSSVRP